MFKNILISLSIVSTLVACTSTPVVKKDPVTGQLSNVKDIALGTTKAPAVTGALFDTNGYTIIGVAYVMAAKSKMDSQSQELKNAYSEHVQNTPGAKPLKQVFLDEFNTELGKRNIKVKAVDVNISLDESKAAVYDFDPKAVDSQKLLVIG